MFQKNVPQNIYQTLYNVSSITVFFEKNQGIEKNFIFPKKF